MTNSEWKKLIELAKLNQQRLDACVGHELREVKVEIAVMNHQRRWQCSLCLGEMTEPQKIFYDRGVKHGHGDAMVRLDEHWQALEPLVKLTRGIYQRKPEGARALAADVIEREKRLTMMLVKATTRLEILGGRMAACEDDQGHNEHDLSIAEIAGWVEEQNALIMKK